MSMEKTKDAAKGRWRDILTHFGIDAALLDGEHHACPICNSGKDRFRFDDMEGNGTSYCSQCEPHARGGMQLLMAFKGWTFAVAAEEVDGFIPSAKVEQAKTERTAEQKCNAIRNMLWNASVIKPGTPPWIYLERRCGEITIPVNDLRYHPRLRHSQENRNEYPAMLALLRYPDGKGASVHKTFLTLDGRKADLDPVRKMAPGLPLEGAAVRLGPIQEQLGIGEGIETSISAGKLSGLTVWSCLSANGILSFIPPEGAKSIVIFGDNDAHKVFEGQKAAYAKAHQLRLKGYDVEVRIPPLPGQDWNDVWNESQQLQGVA